MEAVVKRFQGDSARNANQTLHVCFIDLGLTCTLLNHDSYKPLFSSNHELFNGVDKVIQDLFTDLSFTFHTPTTAKQLDKEQLNDLIKAANNGIVQCPISPLLTFFALVDLLRVLEKASNHSNSEAIVVNDKLDIHLPNGGTNTCFMWKDELVLIASSEEIMRSMVETTKNYMEERKMLPMQYSSCAHVAFQWVESKQVKALNTSFRAVVEDEKTIIPTLTVAKSMNVELLKPLASLILATLK